MSLLDKALKIKATKRERHNFTEEDYELVAAWLLGEIGTSQISAVKGGNSSGAMYSYIAGACKQMVSEGILTVKRR